MTALKATVLVCLAVALCCTQHAYGQASGANNMEAICDGGRFGSMAISGAESIDGKAGCRRYTKGWDVTGTTNFQQTIPVDLCACIKLCKDNYKTCAAWVWKYVDNTKSGGVHDRKCTIYSNLNMPPGTTLGLDPKTSMLGNVGGPMPIPSTGFTQAGGFAPHCQLPPFDANGNGVGWDKNCFSGQLWVLDDETATTVGGAERKSRMFSC